jgi:tRNA(Arg) A34 adenosine deaminase TadA
LFHDLSPGVSPAEGRLRHAAEAAERAVALAEAAARRGTFGVGGLLVDRDGRVLAEAMNAVIADGVVRDPTAHAERQLIDWLFAARRDGLDADPATLAIVSSLDPCAMCAGAILSAGVSVIAVAEDAASGVSIERAPRRMPAPLWPRARAHFAFFGVEGRCPAAGADLGILSAQRIPEPLLERAGTAFLASFERVRQRVGCDPSRSAQDQGALSDAARRQLRRAVAGLPQTLRLPSRRLMLEAGSRAELAAMLGEDASALVDARGEVILAASGAEQLFPARSSVLELIRAYARLRSGDAARPALDLPHPAWCSIVKAAAPDAAAKALLELGAIGSSLEQPRMAQGRAALLFLDPAGLATAQSCAAALPPLYHDIGVDVGAAFR